MMTYKIERTRVYHRRPVRFGNSWLYTVTGPGCHPGGHHGDTVSWARDLCRRLAAGEPYRINETWKKSAA